jgi:hypothetical protein
VKGAKASAALYSIVSTARANGLEPYAYPRRLLTELPKAKNAEDFEAMLPFNTAPIQARADLSNRLRISNTPCGRLAALSLCLLFSWLR